MSGQTVDESEMWGSTKQKINKETQTLNDTIDLLLLLLSRFSRV